jgi:hypothetical protein
MTEVWTEALDQIGGPANDWLPRQVERAVVTAKLQGVRHSRLSRSSRAIIRAHGLRCRHCSQAGDAAQSLSEADTGDDGMPMTGAGQ